MSLNRQPPSTTVHAQGEGCPAFRTQKRAHQPRRRLRPLHGFGLPHFRFTGYLLISEDWNLTRMRQTLSIFPWSSFHQHTSILYLHPYSVHPLADIWTLRSDGAFGISNQSSLNIHSRLPIFRHLHILSHKLQKILAFLTRSFPV